MRKKGKYNWNKDHDLSKFFFLNQKLIDSQSFEESFTKHTLWKLKSDFGKIDTQSFEES